MKSLFQGGKLSGKCTARRRDSGEFLVKENTKGEAGDSESLRLKDREGAIKHFLCPFLVLIRKYNLSLYTFWKVPSRHPARRLIRAKTVSSGYRDTRPFMASAYGLTLAKFSLFSNFPINTLEGFLTGVMSY